ncbi:MAG: SAM-dependent methyltransferase [Eubacterium sp.]|nr:SAM-dependent methyltransferase [Eubacterium sp.]
MGTETEQALREKLEAVFAGDIDKIVLSNGKESEYRKITLEKREKEYQAEKFTQKQAFHETVCTGSVRTYCEEQFAAGFRQCNAWGNGYEYCIKISKKGKVMFSRVKQKQAVKLQEKNNRQKFYYLKEGEAIAPLVDMGVFTKDGKVAAPMYDKYRQINKFVQFIDEAVTKSGKQSLHIIDFGCGKSYLTFVVYYYLYYVKKIPVTMVGLDLKEDVIKKCREAARKYGYEHLKFEVGNIENYKSEKAVDMVITLHACDTATDYALYHAIRWNTEMIISVPCCQHELCGQMESGQFGILTRYGIVKERTAALMTDAIRGNLLEYCGYKTQLLEFIDFTHTPKNILIRAVKSNISREHKQKMLEETRRLMQEFHFRPTLYRLLEEGGMV